MAIKKRKTKKKVGARGKVGARAKGRAMAAAKRTTRAARKPMRKVASARPASGRPSPTPRPGGKRP